MTWALLFHVSSVVIHQRIRNNLILKKTIIITTIRLNGAAPQNKKKKTDLIQIFTLPTQYLHFPKLKRPCSEFNIII